MSDDQFTRLFVHMSEQFDQISKKLDEKASQSSLNSLTNTIDGLAKRVHDYEIESAARDNQFSKLTSWANTASQKIEVPLKNL